MKPDLELKALNSFIGTTEYYRVMGALVTEGVKYIMDNGYGWLVTDALAVICFKPTLRNADFLVVRLNVDTEKAEADMIIDDGNGNILHKQHYKFTDAKRSLKLYYQRGVLMLSSEY